MNRIAFCVTFFKTIRIIHEITYANENEKHNADITLLNCSVSTRSKVHVTW